MTAIDSSYMLMMPDQATFDSPEDLLQYAFDGYKHSHHWSGTNRIGAWEDGGVVDTSGQVYGVSNLYIADASIWPIKVREE